MVKIVVPKGSTANIPLKFAEQTGSVKQYESDFNSFLFFRGVPVWNGVNVADTTGILYEVPEGYFLFLSTISLGFYNTGAVAGNGVQIYINSDPLLLNPAGNVANQAGTLIIPFPIPIKMLPLQKIRVISSDANQRAIGFFSGFLVKI